MASREERLARINRVGPVALVCIAIATILAVALFRSHRISRIEVLYFVAFIPTIMLHEISHGVVALWFGDDTAKRAGRLSLNPIRHIDPIGSVILPVILLLAGGPAFGWAKPVPVSVNQLRHPRNEGVLVGLAGPVTNIILALIAGFIARLLIGPSLLVPFDFPNSGPLIASFFYVFGLVNVIIAVFNLIPVPPLDGSALLERLLPASALPQYYRFRQFSLVFVFLLIVVAPGVLDTLFAHAQSIWLRLVFG